MQKEDWTALKQRAKKGHEEDPTLWLRGVPQHADQMSSEPPEDYEEVELNCTGGEGWVAGSYYTDASGGELT
eukprot:7678940-Lingulodinium_polyedra.AAC.1